MFLSYFKKFPEKDMTLEVVVECPDDGKKTGTVVAAITHPLDYSPKNGKKVFVKNQEEKKCQQDN